MHLVTRVFLFLTLVAAVCMALPSPGPDSAGIVERVNGLAYGGIPYGSISGMLANYRPHSVSRGGPSGVRSVGRRPSFSGLSPHLLNSVYI